MRLLRNFQEVTALFDALFPICRSITGDGLRRSLDILGEYIPLERVSFKTGERVLNWTIPQEWHIFRAFVKNSKGETVRFNNRPTTVPATGTDTLRFTLDVPNVDVWSTDTPNTYRLIMRLRHEGRFTEYIPFKIGFLDRRNLPELKDSLIVYKGVAPDDKTMRAELAAIKKAGYNAIECLYHPAKSRLFDACLETGLYVIDRPNIDPLLIGRGIQLGGSINNNPEWVGAYIFRGENAYMSGRNHQAVVRLTLDGLERAGMYNIYRLENRLRELN